MSGVRCVACFARTCSLCEISIGSDVAGLITNGKLTPDGKHFIVNGEKKWIVGSCSTVIVSCLQSNLNNKPHRLTVPLLTTCKQSCDYQYVYSTFLMSQCTSLCSITGVRTGTGGASGLSMLLLERGMPGLRTRAVNAQ